MPLPPWNVHCSRENRDVSKWCQAWRWSEMCEVSENHSFHLEN